jgi:hypothetical protein
MEEIYKIKIEECLKLLEGLQINGSQNIFILSNIFARLQYILQENEKNSIKIDNTKEDKK